MPARSIGIRIAVEGQADVRRQFDDVAKSGQGAFDGIGRSMDGAGQASDKLATRVRNLTESARQAGVAMHSSLQQNLDKAFNIDAGGSKSASGSASVFAKDMAQTELRARALREAIDPVGAAADRMGASVKGADTLLAKGAITLNEHGAAVALAKRNYESFAGSMKGANDNIGKSTGLAGYQLMNLRSQVFDIATSLQGGQNPFTVLSQQGPQVYEALAGRAGLAGGLTAAKESAAGLLSRFTPMIGAIGGVTAAVTVAAAAYSRFASNQKELSLGLIGTGATTSGVNRVADAGSSIMGGLSSQSIREMSVEFARTRNIGVDMFADLSKFTKDYAHVTGQDLPTATKMVAGAFGDLSKGALDLNGQIGGLDGKTYDLIKRLEQAGDRTGAQRLALAALSANIADAKLQVGSFATAWDVLSAAASRAWEGVGRGAARGVFGGFDLDDKLRNARETLDSSRARAGYLPFGIGERDVKIAEEALHALERLKTARDGLAKENVVSDKTLRGSQVLSAFTPSAADIEALTKWQTTLREALDTGRATSGTAEGLRRINDILRAGGTEAHALGRSARDAFDQADLLPFQKRIAAIDVQFRNLIEAANGNKDVISGLMSAKAAVSGAAVAEATRGPMLEANTALNTQIANLKVQRDTFMLSAGAAGEMAAKQDLLNRYAREGVPITDALNRSIEDYAKRAGDAASANERMQRTQQNIVGGMDELRSGTSGILTGIFSDKRQGKDPLEGIRSGLGRLGDQMFDRTVSKPLTESIFGMSGKGGGGLFGDMASKIFGDASGIRVPSATINATTVTLSGGLGALGGGDILGKLTGGGTGSMDDYARAIRAIESRGSGGYGALGPITGSGDRAYGAYGVMGNNIPSWTKAALGRSISPDEFLKDQAAQDAVFKDQFAKSIAKYGNPQDAASVWFTGRPMAAGADSADILGTTGRGYVDKFNRELGWGRGFSRGADDGGYAPSFSEDDGGYAAASTSFDAASDSIGKLSSKMRSMPGSTDAFSDSLGRLGGKLLGGIGGGGGGGGLLGSIIGLFSGKSGGGGDDGGYAPSYANGGPIFGPGGPRSDSVPIWASAGEYVVNAEAATMHRGMLDAINFGRARAYADGGVIMPARPAIPQFSHSAAPATSSAPKISVHNYAAGVEVTPQVTPQGVALIVRHMLDDNNAKMPGILRDQSERSW